MYMLRTEIRKLGGLICFLFVVLAIQAQQYHGYRRKWNPLFVGKSRESYTDLSGVWNGECGD